MTIPDDVHAFIRAHIDSVEQLEVLLLLARRTERGWSGDSVALELRLHPRSAEARLIALARRGLLSAHEGQFRFEPADRATTAVVARVARTYGAMRASVISLICVQPAR